VDGAKFEHGLGSGETPAGSGDAKPVLNQMATSALDDAGRNGQSLREEFGERMTVDALR